MATSKFNINNRLYLYSTINLNKIKHTVFYKSERKMLKKIFLLIYHYISVVTVPKCLYLVPIPVKIHGFGTKAKHKNMQIKKHTIFINEVKQNVIYKNQCHFLCLFKIVFQVFPQVIKVW